MRRVRGMGVDVSIPLRMVYAHEMDGSDLHIGMCLQIMGLGRTSVNIWLPVMMMQTTVERGSSLLVDVFRAAWIDVSNVKLMG